jgi:hypothetical protein
VVVVLPLSNQFYVTTTYSMYWVCTVILNTRETVKTRTFDKSKPNLKILFKNIRTHYYQLGIRNYHLPNTEYRTSTVQYPKYELHKDLGSKVFLQKQQTNHYDSQFCDDGQLDSLTNIVLVHGSQS